MEPLRLELLILWIALVAYVLGGSAAIVALILRRRWDVFVLGALAAGVALHTGSLAFRWVRLGHGPFVSMFEILSSNLWGLMLAFVIAYWRIRAVRPMGTVVVPILFMLMAWTLMKHPGETVLPSTYSTVWLYVHIGFAKVFFGSALVATGVAGLILIRRRGVLVARLETLPPDDRLEELIFRLMALALVFDSLMLIAGAIWAQNAWGRYWAWDPLETWSFLTWLSVAVFLHLRVTFRLSPVQSAWLAIGVFVLAFLTFLGVPFISAAPHKGAV